MAWSGDIAIEGDRIIQDITLSSGAREPPLLLPKTSLHFLSVVDIPQIPLHLISSTPYLVSASRPETEQWFHSILLASCPAAESETPWWLSAAVADSPLGILVSVNDEANSVRSSVPRATELLFYASKHEAAAAHNEKASTELSVYAIALSSDLLYQVADGVPTPPSSPEPHHVENEAVFLAPSVPQTETVNNPPVRKRKNAADAFDQANQRRSKARRRGGEGVSAVAARGTESRMPSLKHRRSSSTTSGVPIQSRPLSRSPSVVSSRPATGMSSGPKRSSLARLHSLVDTIPSVTEETSIETKNKDLISRIVMAGMRLYGLSQSRPRRSRTSSTAPSPAPDADESERANDDEYKQVYHQVFKGTCFAFRLSITRQSLHAMSEAVRDVVDKLLGIFCSDPLVGSLESVDTGTTPGGRNAFGSERAKADVPKAKADFSGAGEILRESRTAFSSG